jgi:hypothetical protein
MVLNTFNIGAVYFLVALIVSITLVLAFIQWLGIWLNDRLDKKKIDYNKKNKCCACPYCGCEVCIEKLK